MEMQQLESSASPPTTDPGNHNSHPTAQHASTRATPSIFSASGLSSWAKGLKIPQLSSQEDQQSENAGKSTLARFGSGLGLRLSPKSPQKDENTEGTTSTIQPGVLSSLTKGIMDSSISAVKAVQVKARHIVSQNKRRYQEDGFDLDMTYITENIIAMGFPAGNLSSGFFGYVEGFYRNHMEEVIKFFETHHKGKYKVYNLCSERLYDASLFEGKNDIARVITRVLPHYEDPNIEYFSVLDEVACFPFDDHNCPPVQLIKLFCQSAYSWLKEDIENVVVVHCKAGIARTGLMISSLLLYLKFLPTAEESIEYYNQKRCVDGKGLVLPSQIRYVKYFERILTNFNGENQPGRRCMLRGLRLHKCPYWIRPSITVSNHNGVLFSTKKHPKTKDLMISGSVLQKKGIIVFALPGEPGLSEVAGDFKIHFHDRQGDFYCWLNTTMMENRMILNMADLDDFDKRKLPSPGLQVEVVIVDYDGSQPLKPTLANLNKKTDVVSATSAAKKENNKAPPSPNPVSESQDKDDVFSDSEGEDGGSPKIRHNKVASNARGSANTSKISETDSPQPEVVSLKSQQGLPVDIDASKMRSEGKSKNTLVSVPPEVESSSMSEFKAIAADASVFSFGDEEDYESE